MIQRLELRLLIINKISSLSTYELLTFQSGDRDKLARLGEVMNFVGQYMALLKKELSPLDFRSTKSNWLQFPNHGSKRLPPGTVTDFEWKDYCPEVFSYLQELDNIDYADYMLSVRDHETLREVSSSRKSGCLCLSRDGGFVIKTIRKSEIKMCYSGAEVFDAIVLKEGKHWHSFVVLVEMLPKYCHHVEKYRATLLTKFYGLHLVTPVGGPKVYFVVMENIFQSELYIHRRFDLKGSSQGRTVSKVAVDESTTFKDLDLDLSFHIDPMTRQRLLTQIKYDCEFLEAEGIMGYSLLLGLHVEAPHGGSFDGRSLTGNNTFSNSSSQEHGDSELTLADICQQSYRPDLKLGVKIPARAVRVRRYEKGSVSSHRKVGARESYNVILFMGIIDILQGYNLFKRIEHAYKSIQFDSMSITAVNPKAYSTRFQDFLSKVFPAEDLDF
ncbi:hypothetical protein HHK36_029083 [Tetracentron sinense]|uniref:1-phosphatidylinositol-4-phosphate 5-kinase n=1 Tax=Tetracentron sinense TaxID=13715 RepID=A0A834YG70_TETSI|nr:hypothetical protein HHK36_029083 [Tetracentron sinense]